MRPRSIWRAMAPTVSFGTSNQRVALDPSDLDHLSVAFASGVELLQDKANRESPQHCATFPISPSRVPHRNRAKRIKKLYGSDPVSSRRGDPPDERGWHRDRPTFSGARTVHRAQISLRKRPSGWPKSSHDGIRNAGILLRAGADVTGARVGLISSR